MKAVRNLHNCNVSWLHWHYFICLESKKWKWSYSVVSDSVTPWTAAYQAHPSLGFSRREYWSGLPFPSPGDLPDPGIEPMSLASAGRFFTTEPPGKRHATQLSPSTVTGESPHATTKTQHSQKHYKTEKINRQKEHSKNQCWAQSRGNGPRSLFSNPPFTSLPDWSPIQLPSQS